MGDPAINDKNQKQKRKHSYFISLVSDLFDGIGDSHGDDHSKQDRSPFAPGSETASSVVVFIGDESGR